MKTELCEAAITVVIQNSKELHSKLVRCTSYSGHWMVNRRVGTLTSRFNAKMEFQTAICGSEFLVERSSKQLLKDIRVADMSTRRRKRYTSARVSQAKASSAVQSIQSRRGTKQLKRCPLPWQPSQ